MSDYKQFDVGDIVYVPYMTDVPAGFYEVSSVNPLWIKDDHKGSYNSQNNNLGNVVLVSIYQDRLDK